MVDPRGAQVKTLTLVDPDRIKMVCDSSTEFSSMDALTMLTRDAVIPLLLDVRSLLMAAADMLNGLTQIGNITNQLIHQQNAREEAKIQKSILDLRSGAR